MPEISLTPELDRFAEECVRSGRYASLGEVHRAAMRLLQDAERQRAAFVAGLDAAVEEGRRRGFAQVQDALEEMDAEIEAAERRGGEGTAPG